MTTSIVLSAAYTGSELDAEFGPLPPAFLPLGGRRLISYQAEALPEDGRRILSLPESFALSEGDAALLARLGLEVLRVPDGLPLGTAVIHLLVLIGIGSHPVRLLHGDTLLPSLNFSTPDLVSVAPTVAPYNLGSVSIQDGCLTRVSQEHTLAQQEREVLSGYFHIGDAGAFAGEIVRAGGDFVAGLNAYVRGRPVEAVRSEPWFDFGHVTTFYESRRRITTERAFNKLQIDERTVTKSGADQKKIEAEARWFESLPADLRIYTPHYLGRAELNGQPGYRLEYVYRPSLADLFVFGDLPRSAWSGIFSACDEVLTAFAQHGPMGAKIPGDPYLGKTLARLDAFAKEAGIDLEASLRLNGAAAPSLRRIAEDAAALIPKDESACIIHGDFCFSNLLYDARGRRLITLDPRGLDSERAITNLGDLRYDIAKLYHSVVGLYDHIVAGYSSVNRSGQTSFELALPGEDRIRAVQDIFQEVSFAGRRPDQAAAAAIAVHLFLSMLPLHHDRPDRQEAFVANAIRLYLGLARS